MDRDRDMGMGVGYGYVCNERTMIIMEMKRGVPVTATAPPQTPDERKHVERE